MLVTLIAAVAENRIIGREGDLPWRLPDDLRRFKRVTTGHVVIMGRRTWESLPGLLPRRIHIVVTRTPGYRADGCLVVGSPDAALKAVDAPEFMIVGGETLYRTMLPRADRMYLTLVAASVEGDASFPAWDDGSWRETSRAHRRSDDRNPYDLTFLTFERTRPD